MEDRDEKLESMRILVEHIVPGRTADARGPSKGELKATEMIAMTITEASAKVRTGPPIDSKRDHQLSVWAGELPLSVVAGVPVPDEDCLAPLPGYVTAYQRPDGSGPAAP